jgi:3-phenylpropionate/trans-cinnamate dioxygenase ferredoxin reductase subunit
MASPIRIVGAGQAGLQVALNLRERGYAGPMTLVGAEPHLPYHRPPLSKRGLAEAIGAGDLAIRNSAFIEQRGIELRLGTAVSRIDRAARMLDLADGTRLDYSSLVLATGSVPRRLDLAGADLPNVVGLKDIADLERLRSLLPGTERAVLIGGGFVGLELASSLTRAGIAVTVLEAAPRLLARVASPDLSAFVEAVHRARGVDIRTSVGVSAISGGDRARAVRLASGEEIATDLVLVGIGAEADDRLAAEAGLRTDRGICVDADGRTSDPAIYAAGDCARFDHPFYGAALRLESVNNALDQARSVAASIMGQARPIATVPWFWSDQFDLKIQLAGVSSPLDRIEVVADADGFVRHFTAGGMLRAVEAVNAPRAFMLARRRIEAEMAALNALEGAA